MRDVSATDYGASIDDNAIEAYKAGWDAREALTLAEDTELKRNYEVVCDDLANNMCGYCWRKMEEDPSPKTVTMVEALETKLQAAMGLIEETHKIIDFYATKDSKIDEYEKEYEDDSDFEDNAATNGYFPVRPSDKEADEYLELISDNGKRARETLTRITKFKAEGAE